MASLAVATQSALAFLLSIYAILWSALTSIATTVYSTLHFASKAYKPAKKLLVSIEGTFRAIRSTSLNNLGMSEIQKIVADNWTPDSVLECLGMLSVAIPVLVVVLAGAGCVLLVALMATVAFLIFGVLALPAGVGCAIAYTAGIATQHLVGLGVFALSTLRSAIGSAKANFTRRHTRVNSKNTVPGDNLKGASDVSEVEPTSPKITATIEKEEKSNGEASAVQ